MGRLERRLKRLEQSATVPEEEVRRDALRTFYERLTFGELEWLNEPMERAEALVECPYHGSECGCRNERRRERAREEHPELWEEYVRRHRSLQERAEEILSREPTDPAASWRRRYAVGA